MMYTRLAFELEDNYSTFGADEIKGLKLDQKPSRTLPYDNNFINSVTFELELDQIYYYRRVYKFLDFLSELGGLFSAFSRICLVVITGLNYFGSFQYVMADNFYYRGGRDSTGEVYKNDVQWNSLKSLRLNAHTFLPKGMLICCCKPNRAQKIRAKCYDHSMQETSISHIIQQLRVLNAACKETRSPVEWEALRHRHSMMAFEDFDSNDEQTKEKKMVGKAVEIEMAAD